jgi:TRAP-type C4-dicarboxylate transport system substrate-binding protein
MPITETYTSLARGVVDGTVSPWEGVAVFKFDEVIKYSTQAGFYTMTMIIAMNKDKYESLPDDLKKIIDDTTGLVMSERLGKAYDEVEIPLRNAAVKKGVQIAEFESGEMNRLREKTMHMRGQWVEEMSAKGYPAQEILDTAIKYTESY